VLGLFYRNGRAYRLWFGPLRGMRMYYDRSINFHAILGLWDTETFEILNRLLVTSGLLPDDSVVVDVGANIGYYAMWLSVVAIPKGQVFCFEPSPFALQFLRKNLALNRINNAAVIDSACGNLSGSADFFIAEHHHRSSFHAAWAGRDNVQKISVPTTTLDDFFSAKTGRRHPTFIKFDIEGGGTDALPGCERLLREHRPFVLIESHTPDEDRAISNVLCQFDYRGYRLNTKKWIERPDGIHPLKDGVWGTMLLVPSEHYPRINSLIALR
jgi:FkbM family methyltransferase